MGNVILWSGGPDSTLILHKLAIRGPVRALTLTDYPFLNKRQERAQYYARINYIHSLDNDIYRNIKLDEIAITGSANIYADHKNELGEPLIFLCYCMPSIKDKDIVFLGYLNNTIFSRNIDTFRKTWDTIMELKGMRSELKFPYIEQGLDKLKQKAEILRQLEEYNISESCYWSCSRPIVNNNKYIPCNTCKKCKEKEQARKG